jgi:hypothetical protein
MVGEVGYALRLPKDLKAKLERWARAEHRSMNGQIVSVLEDAVRQAEKDGQIPA